MRMQELKGVTLSRYYVCMVDYITFDEHKVSLGIGTRLLLLLTLLVCLIVFVCVSVALHIGKHDDVK